MDRLVLTVDTFGNVSSGTLPLGLAIAKADGPGQARRPRHVDRARRRDQRRRDDLRPVAPMERRLRARHRATPSSRCRRSGSRIAGRRDARARRPTRCGSSCPPTTRPTGSARRSTRSTRRSFAEFVLCVVDNGSRDATVEVVRAWSAAHPRRRRVGSSTSPRRGSVPPSDTGIRLAIAEGADDRRPNRRRLHPACRPGPREMRGSILGGLDLVVGKPVPRRDQAPLRRGRDDAHRRARVGGEPGRTVAAQQPGPAIPRAVPAVHRRQPRDPRRDVPRRRRLPAQPHGGGPRGPGADEPRAPGHAPDRPRTRGP